MPRLLEIRDLSTCFDTPAGIVRAVDGVSLALEQGDTLGVVGESGCGKTVLALSVMRLVPIPPGRTEGGEILFNGRDLLSLDAAEMMAIRGRDISMIFQEPMTALNPVFRVGDQIMEVVRRHRKIGYREALNHAIGMLTQVGIPQPEKRFRDYPHQLSGGMRQRVMIAIALACRPKLMLADEPTTALDVTIQAQIIDLLNQMKQEMATAIILITHDLGVVAESAQKVAVMYAGEIIEYAKVESIFQNPRHPYTVGLLESIPPLDKMPDPEARLKTISGAVPELFRQITGCRFHDRCPLVMEICRKLKPALKGTSEQHTVRCWKYD